MLATTFGLDRPLKVRFVGQKDNELECQIGVGRIENHHCMKALQISQSRSCHLTRSLSFNYNHFQAWRLTRVILAGVLHRICSFCPSHGYVYGDLYVSRNDHPTEPGFLLSLRICALQRLCIWCPYFLLLLAFLLVFTRVLPLVFCCAPCCILSAEYL